MTCLCSTSCHSATLRMAASCVSRKIRSWFLQSPREKDWRNVTGAFPIGSQDTRGSDTVLFISARWAPSIRRPVLCTCLCHDTCPPDPKLWLNAVILCEVFLETSSLHALPPFPQPATPFSTDIITPAVLVLDHPAGPPGVRSEIVRMCTSTDGNAFVRMAMPQCRCSKIRG